MISFYFKTQFPIDSESCLEKLKQSLIYINNHSSKLKEYDVYYIKDPIYNTIHTNINCNTEEHLKTKMILEHFYDTEYYEYFEKREYKKLRFYIICKIIFQFILLVISICGLIMTFKYLENKELSLAPIVSLFFIVIVGMLFFLNIKRFLVFRLVESGEITLDMKILKLLKLKLDKENTIREEKNILKKDCMSFWSETLQMFSFSKKRK